MSNEYDSDNCSAVTIYDVTINDIDSDMQVLTDKKDVKLRRDLKILMMIAVHKKYPKPEDYENVARCIINKYLFQVTCRISSC